MAEITNELMYETLKTIRADIAEVRRDVRDIAAELRGVKGHMASFMANEVAQDSAIASLKDRIERIERRLELTE